MTVMIRFLQPLLGIARLDHPRNTSVK